jgi:hypothetical protein
MTRLKVPQIRDHALKLPTLQICKPNKPLFLLNYTAQCVVIATESEPRQGERRGLSLVLGKPRGVGLHKVPVGG